MPYALGSSLTSWTARLKVTIALSTSFTVFARPCSPPTLLVALKVRATVLCKPRRRTSRRDKTQIAASQQQRLLLPVHFDDHAHLALIKTDSLAARLPLRSSRLSPCSLTD